MNQQNGIKYAVAKIGASRLIPFTIARNSYAVAF